MATLTQLVQTAPVDTINKFIQESKPAVNETDDHGYTALHLSAHRPEVVQLLLSSGANPNVQTANNIRPIHLAARAGSAAAIEALTKAGADPQAPDQAGWTPLHYATFNGHIAAMKVLLEHQANPNAETLQKSTALHLASFRGNRAAISLLIESGADLNARDADDHTPFSLLSVSESPPPPRVEEEIPSMFAKEVALFLNSQQYSDYQFKVSDSAQPVYAHRIILAARSPYFRAKLALDSAESVETLRDTRRDTLMAVLEQIYTGECKALRAETDPNNIFDAALLAHLFALNSVTALAENLIRQKITPATALSLFERSESLGHPLGESFRTYLANYLIQNAHALPPPSHSSRRLFLAVVQHASLRPREVKWKPHAAQVEPVPSAQKKAYDVAGPASPTAAPQISEVEALRIAKNTVLAISKDKDAWPFLEPVDPIKYGIPDYPTIIKHPMDLGTIKKKMRDNVYRTAQMIADDVRLTFQNALVYNAPGSDISRMSEKLLSMFESRMAKAGVKLEPLSPTLVNLMKQAKEASLLPPILLSPPPAPERKRTRESAGGSSNGATTRSASKPAAVDEEAELRRKAQTPMSIEEIRALGAKIETLTGDHLQAVLEIMKQGSTKPTEGEGDEFEIDMEDLDQLTLRRLEAYVQKITRPRQRPVADDDEHVDLGEEEDGNYGERRTKQQKR